MAAMSSLLPDGSDLKFRIERIKRLDNIRLDAIKFLYDGCSIVERYTQNRAELHIHLHPGVAPVCGVFRRGHRDENVVSDQDEFPVFLHVAEVAQRPRPVASVVRLQLLDSCDMSVIKPGQIAPTMFPEAILGVINRKLSLLHAGTTVQPSELVNKVVEGRSEMVRPLDDQQRNFVRDSGLAGLDAEELARLIWAYRHVRVDVHDCGICLSGTHAIMQIFKGFEMFACPIYPEIRVTQ